MPGMGGMETTQHIHQYCREHDLPLIPIIALTADVTETKRENFMQAGMNDYETKPINENKLKALLNAWTPCQFVLKQSKPVKPSQAHQGKQPALIDRTLGAQLAGGKQETAEKLLGLLVTQLPQDKTDIETALQQQDWQALGDLIHKLHGACCYCGVPALKAASKKAERLIKFGNTKRAQTAINALLAAITDTLSEYDKPA